MSGSINKDPRDVIIAPVVSEKSYGQLDEGKYTFEVATDSNKLEIKQAIEKIFDVKVASVNTINRQGKRKRTRCPRRWKRGGRHRSDQRRACLRRSNPCRRP